jgi:hypothetical protein
LLNFHLAQDVLAIGPRVLTFADPKPRPYSVYINTTETETAQRVERKGTYRCCYVKDKEKKRRQNKEEEQEKTKKCASVAEEIDPSCC